MSHAGTRAPLRPSWTDLLLLLPFLALLGTIAFVLLSE
jgi:hypothetical protein